MLGKSYFDVARAIHRAGSFDDLVELLVTELPLLLGADEVLVTGVSPLSGFCSVAGHGPIAKVLAERIGDVNRLMPEHPLSRRVDFENPGDLGFALSDFVSPEEYRSSAFVRELFGQTETSDVLFGMLVQQRRRKAFLQCYFSGGSVGLQARERFDAILLTARGVADRLEAHHVESSVRRRIFAGSAKSPLAIFIVNLQAEICPLNHAAVELAERWWEADEALRMLPPSRYAELEKVLDASWENPVDAHWSDVTLDLGGGEMAVHALPKLSGEIILILQMPGVAEAMDEVSSILTRRQREIMDWIAEGKTSGEAAIILGISPRTVEKHLEAVFQRLGVENRIAAMRRYLDLKRGL